jgi:hypothetical protein
VARLVADRFERATGVESDWFWTTIVRGHVPLWLADADAQNRTVLRTGMRRRSTGISPS